MDQQRTLIEMLPELPNKLADCYALLPWGTIIAAALILPVLRHLYNDYHRFISLGPGGTPQTLAGYMKVKALSLLALSNPYQPAAVPEAFRDAPGYLVNLPGRKSKNRPVAEGIAPHRQTTQKASEALYQKLHNGIHRLGDSSEHLVIGTSCFEKHGTGLFSVSPERRTCKGEICHVHPSDGSMHLTLHPADAKVVLEAAWGERHPLARGGWFERFVPGTFVMVYSPTTEDEVDTVLSIVKAAVWYVSGEDAVKDIYDERRDSGYVSSSSTEAGATASP